MAEKSFEEIVRMIFHAFNNTTNSGIYGEKEAVLECATQIYIAQMNTRTPKERGGEK